ncbi:hypothetical protein C8A05DRAFT_38255 [Staphylotrichum tortipilum]|uniref:Uncharacterized protein n=1 Tax=Staphylotrichum tortipilum TaxID=2831512 RepID=A0AAN6MCC0_9PEZI|nr:hypothetical protein C8A05DRAFT_38255 [Staphylotrichum longicolle]
MGHSSKFVFPLPGRKPKPTHAQQPPPPALGGPYTTKAQKILGTTELTVDGRAWETHSNSGISIAVTETTNGDHSHAGTATRDRRGISKGARERRWEQESEIIPAALNRPHDLVGSMAADGATDGSSLRRRQSSSTITSYYDKTSLPLAISQQTSNSAMAKGLPAKAQALLDIDGEFSEPPQLAGKAKKKPSKLDLSSLLRGHRSPKHLHPDSNNKGQLLGHDMLTRSPSPMSTSTSAAPTPSPNPQRGEWGLRKKVTKESLRETQASPYGSRSASSKEQPTKASIDLYNLYDHYEQRTFADAMDEEFSPAEYHVQPPTAGLPPTYPPPPPGQSGKAYLSPLPANGPRHAHPSNQQPPQLTAAELRRAGAGTPSSPVPADCASISSRHTRTSKASKRTDRSLQEIDLLQNSVLALSSDSEEDDYELSSKGSLAVPTLSDGQVSPTSPRSPVSQSSMGPYDVGARSKPVKRAAFVPNPQGLHPQSSAQPKGPKISPRTSSLNSKVFVPPGHALVHETSRLSIGTTSTDRTVSHGQNSGANAASAPKAPKKMRSESQFDFPAPPAHRSVRSASVSRVLDQLPSTAPTSVDLYLQSQRSPAPLDNGSIRSGASHGSANNGGRRGSATSSIHDGSSGRFMAVTRQEEMLLAALRMKRARMREDIIAEFEGDNTDREDHQLRRVTTAESIMTANSMSRQSSMSTMRQEMGTLSARPRHQAQPLPLPTATMMEKNNTLKIIVDRTSYDSSLRTPASEISDFIHFDESVGMLGPNGLERRDSKASSISSQKSAAARQRASLGAPTPAQRRAQRREVNATRVSEQYGSMAQNDLPLRIPEDPAEDEDVGVPRPDSPISPSDFPTPISIKNNKQVRLSAVGFYKPSDAGW